MENTVTPSVLLFGATGLVGGYVLEQLIADITVLNITVISRTPIAVSKPKMKVVVSDLKNLKTISTFFNEADTIFCCLGTTIKKVKTKEAFKAVDYDLPLAIARMAKEKGVKKFIALSSLGADPESRNFYLRTKGEMERDIAVYQFQKLAFLRPSMLIGPRKEFRFAERMMLMLMVLITPFLRGKLKKYRAINAQSVAKAMIHISQSLNNNRVYESEELVWLGT